MSKVAYSSSYLRGMEHLVEISQQLSHAKNLEDIINVTQTSARHLTGADGATFILREKDLCFYVDEDAIAPLWKGQKFPVSQCVSGWAMLNKSTAVIEDIFQDPRIPIEFYRPTFVKSMVMVPIRKNDPIGAIGNYWAKPHKASEEEVRLLDTLANSAAIALENVRLISDMQKVNMLLQSSLEVRDELITIASHELKTPLTSLLLQLQSVHRQVDVETSTMPTPAQLVKALDLSIRQVYSLKDLIEKLLDLSEVRLGRLQLQFHKVNLSQKIKNMAEQFTTELSAAKCPLKLALEDNIEIECDSARIEQVVANLVSNVLKYACGTDVKITLKKPAQGIVLFSIEDKGPGIPKEMHEKIFERFGRGVSPKNKTGIGLGLFISRALIEAHGGRIYVESTVGSGSKFTVELPSR
jgi:signal transduction histidine kinase